MSADVFCYGLGVNLHYGLGAGLGAGLNRQSCILKNPGKAGTIKNGTKRPNVQIKEIWI